MKKLLTLVAVALLAFMATGTANAEGLKFIKASSLAEAQKIAFDQDKILLLDVYTTWCPPCQRLSADVFPSPDVEDLNEFMIGYKLDAEKGEGIEVAKKLGVRAYPTLVFFIGEGEELGRMEGAPLEPNAFVETVVTNIEKWIDAME